MFNSEAFNELEFNTIMAITMWIPGSFPIVEANNYHLFYDTEIVPLAYIGEQQAYANNPWSPHKGFGVNDWLLTNELELYFAGSDGRVYKYGDTDTDNDNKIDAYYVTKSIDLDVPDRIKVVRWVDVDYEVEPGSILRVYYRADNDTEWIQLTEIDQGSGRYVFLEMPKLSFRKISFKFANAYIGCKFKINKFALDMVIHGQQKEMI
jgi:hypothetical protein